ncbi:MAG: GGDEF domain-containing protein [Candidatus Omnitrophota bacterium]|nr:MAG: GGDEF domain-containing protein [Candidatus Omnitrophota bacterium]
MYCGIIIVIFAALFLGIQVIVFRRFIAQRLKEKEYLQQSYKQLLEEEESLKHEKGKVEERIGGQFLFYDVTRKIAPLLDRKDLFSVFSEGIKDFDIDEISFHTPLSGSDHLEFQLGSDPSNIMSVKTRSKKGIEYLPLFAKLLGLCLERINLYEKLQQLSIYDTLTEVHNRRYFLQRLFEEFERAKKSNLNLSFLMADIDHFKKINDTYGHLVGDVVLREIAQSMKGNIREIDFVARYGGEEFSIILPDTDRAGAILVAERISTLISQKKIKAFDETVSVTVSVGVAAYPENTVHPDVLIEIADKALYKAKTSGRSRVGWF